MSEIKYGILAEDSACKIFIEQTIPQLEELFCENMSIRFEHESALSNKYKPNGSGYIKKKFVRFVRDGILSFGIDLCFVGRDADDGFHNDIFLTMLKELDESGLDSKAIFFIPVQAIEYWLWYLKAKRDNPEAEKVAPIEEKARGKMKKLVYGKTSGLRTRHTNPIVEQLSKSFDINWLRQCSESFNHFVNEFEQYINSMK